MAKGRKNNRTGRVASAQRYTPTAARSKRVPRFSVSLSPLPARTFDPLAVLASPVADRRTWHPMGPLTRPWASAPASASRQVAKQNPSYVQPSYSKAIVAFAEPEKVAVCVRRKQRKAVLHAKGVAGRKGLRPPRRNLTSDYSCR